MQKHLRILLLILWTSYSTLLADNQTATVSPVHSGDTLPFRLKIETASFSLPIGLHSYASATYQGKWLLIAGRTDGLHGFSTDPNNFPAESQNRNVYVVNPSTGTVVIKSLTDPSSKLSQGQIDTLSVTSPQFYQDEKTLYITGGYGIDTYTGIFGTKDALTAIDIPGLIHWVETDLPYNNARKHISQTFNPIFQIAGGYMGRTRDKDILLVFGQNFKGFYEPSDTGAYSEQVRRFRIKESGKKLSYSIHKPKPITPDPDYRRRDLNVVPIIHYAFDTPIPAYVALSGVFTPTGGVWTVPVLIDIDGKSKMQDPEDPETFKQAMNQYVCPVLNLYSKHLKNMYISLFGGLSYGFFENGTFQTDSEIPFINQVTTISLNKEGEFAQFLMKATYPTILSTDVHPGNPYLFGAGAQFIPAAHLPTHSNGVIKFDQLEKTTLVGYIVGGIRSTLPNTNTQADSSASPYIFKVILKKNIEKEECKRPWVS